MLTSLAYIFLVGLAMAAIVQKVRLPRIVGMLLTGIVLGPFVLNLLDPSILGISGELRKMALIVILIKAGLSLDIPSLRKVGRPALMMSFVPALCEVGAVVVLAPLLLGVTYTEAAIMGAVLSAVSPAVVVPRMVHLMGHKYGTEKSIPQMLLAGSSLDDVFVIVLFTSFLSIEQGGKADVGQFLQIPISILVGIAIGAAFGVLLSTFFEYHYQQEKYIRNSFKVIVILGLAFLLVAMEDWFKPVLPMSGMLAVMSMALVVGTRSVESVTVRLQQKFGKLWLASEVILFVLVGAAVDIRYTLSAGLGAVALIFLALCIRAVGVCICMMGTNLNWKERLYCVIAYIPKATIQAAIGSVPLSMGLPCGKLVLSVAVLAILITAPLGAFGMDCTYKKLLVKED